MAELQAAASAMAPCCSLSPGSSLLEAWLAEGLGEWAQGSCKAIWLAGQEAIVNCLVTHIATSPDPELEMLSCINGRCSRPE